jgi:hypothetical protein
VEHGDKSKIFLARENEWSRKKFPKSGPPLHVHTCVSVQWHRVQSGYYDKSESINLLSDVRLSLNDVDRHLLRHRVSHFGSCVHILICIMPVMVTQAGSRRHI